MNEQKTNLSKEEIHLYKAVFDFINWTNPVQVNENLNDMLGNMIDPLESEGCSDSKYLSELQFDVKKITSLTIHLHQLKQYILNKATLLNIE